MPFTGPCPVPRSTADDASAFTKAPVTNTDFGPTATTSVPSSEACANRRFSSDVSSWRTAFKRSASFTS